MSPVGSPVKTCRCEPHGCQSYSSGPACRPHRGWHESWAATPLPLPDYYVPIGASRPVVSQLSTTATGDLIFTTFSGVTSLSPVPPFSSIFPFNGVPTYQGCLGDTDEQSNVSAGQGTAFCLSETGLMVGGVVIHRSACDQT